MKRTLYSLLLVDLLAFAGAVRADSPYAPAVQTGTITASAITENSGVAASRLNTGVLWTHNDSGDSARVFAISTTGSLLETFNLSGATNVDYEDIAVGPGPIAGVNYLYVGDIGDNNADRTSIAVYRVPEPTVGSGQGTLTNISKINLVYPDGVARNAETLMVDPLTGDIYVVTKQSPVGRVYRAAFPQSTSGNVTLQYLSNVQIPLATGGDISADGTKMIVRDKTDAFEWTINPGETIADALLTPFNSFALHSEQQGEGIGYSYSTDPRGPGFYTTSEGLDQPLYFYAAVPEPSSAGLIGVMGFAALASRRRRGCKFIESKQVAKEN